MRLETEKTANALGATTSKNGVFQMLEHSRLRSKNGKMGVFGPSAFVTQKWLQVVTHWRDLRFGVPEGTEATRGYF